jgi:methyl-accepting chemotaxis protein
MFGKLKVGAKLGLAFFVVIALAMALAGVSLNRISAMNDQWQDFERVTLAKRTSLTAAFDRLAEGVQAFKNYVIRGGDHDKKFGDSMAAVEKAVEGYRAAGSLTKTEEDHLRAVLDGVKGYRAGMAKLVEMRAKPDVTVTELDKAVAGADKVIAKPLGEMRELVRARTKTASEEIAHLLSSAQQLVAVMTGAVMLVAILFAWLITRAITRPLNEAVGVAKRVAAGDLTSLIEVKSADETGMLLQALKDMNESLYKIVAEVRVGTDAISTASQEIASGNADLSQRTEEQASSLEETASSMEELASTVKANAENAKQANQLAANASEVAVKGGSVVGEVVQTMSSINESSKKIADIIGVIDGIAFQTNILALNAAVEAARAGEQGRGFAVVASEVRTLAQRSAAAAKEIKELISDSVTKVGNGTKLVDEAGKTMDEIVGAVKRVTDIMGEITAATHEQSSGIEQVNTAVGQMDQVTQQNAALVEEAAAAAESMREQAGSLQSAVSVFRLANDAAPAAKAVSVERAAPSAKVTRLPAPKKSASPVAAPMKKTGTDDEWSEF